jgi:hypothetical protein
VPEQVLAVLKGNPDSSQPPPKKVLQVMDPNPPKGFRGSHTFFLRPSVSPSFAHILPGGVIYLVMGLEGPPLNSRTKTNSGCLPRSLPTTERAV